MMITQSKLKERGVQGGSTIRQENPCFFTAHKAVTGRASLGETVPVSQVTEEVSAAVQRSPAPLAGVDAALESP